MGVHLHPTYVIANRAAIEAEIERLIDLLDCVDGDPDLEDDDPSGDPLDRGELDESRYLSPPVYGVDQTKGPINEAAALREYHRSSWGGHPQ